MNANELKEYHSPHNVKTTTTTTSLPQNTVDFEKCTLQIENYIPYARVRAKNCPMNITFTCATRVSVSESATNRFSTVQWAKFDMESYIQVNNQNKNNKTKQRNDGLLRLEVWRKVVFTWFQWMAEWNNGIEPNTNINVIIFFDGTLGQSVEMNFLRWCWLSFFLLLSHLLNELNINSLIAFHKCGVDQENEMSMLFDGSAAAHTKC